MNLYLLALRLYLVWFALIHLMAGYVFAQTHYISLGLATEIAGMALVYFLAWPATRKHRYFFNNQGRSALAMYLNLAVMNVAAFTVLVSMISCCIYA